ncbi:MAG: hypothetical protein GY949_23485 [Gammaproteobacteria bacterium]|nr:hypothetical protein [Gammaproteobacteria bacterium]
MASGGPTGAMLWRRFCKSWQPEPMPRTCILHIGMHKTGSSSIQRTLVGWQSEHLVYADLGKPNPANHSAALSTLFGADDTAQDLHRRDGRSLEDIARLRSHWRTGFDRVLADPARRDVIFSAEALSIWYLERSIVEALHSALSAAFGRIRVIAYIRPPVSFMQSIFQQYIKGGLDELLPDLLYPRYQARLEKWIEVFGSDAVELIRFSPETLVGGGAVTDFAARTGVDLSGTPVRHANPSMSLEALACLFAQRKYGLGFAPERKAAQKNLALIGLLNQLGDQRLRFAPALVDPVLAAQGDDLDWIEARLGQPLRDCATDRPGAIGSEADLLALAAILSAPLVRLARASGVKAGRITKIRSRAGGARRTALLVDALRAARFGAPPKRRFDFLTARPEM